MLRLRSIILSSLTFAPLLILATGAGAQAPWKVTIRPVAATLLTGQCTPVRLELLDGPGKAPPRNPAGVLVSLADFDMSVTGTGVVGRYSGAADWSACACPASAGGSAVITASYPASNLPGKSKAPGVAFQTAITVPIAAGTGSGVPIGCEKLKTTTTAAGGTAPWSVTLTTSLSAIPIGTCAPIGIDLRDAGGKEFPRNPAGKLVSLADFDMTVTGGGAAGLYAGASNWSVCGCQAGTPGSLTTIVATYPAAPLAANARSPGVAFQSSMRIPLGAAVGRADPPACSGAGSRTIVTTQPVATAPVAITPAAPTPVTAPQPTRTAVPAAPVTLPPAPAPSAVTVSGTSVSATLSWQPVAGVASYVVTRQQGNLPAVSQTLAAANTGMYDSGLQPATAYSWTIRAIQADGREGSVSVSFTTPAAAIPAPPAPPAPAPSSPTSKLTGFQPKLHGFQFTNDFKNNFIGPPISMITSGLCGGMSYTVLDYYNAKLTVPNQDWRPAHGTVLQMYLYERQVSSLLMNIDKWIETTVNPFGSRSTEFFNWGINERLVELRSFIDRGVPVNLGLKGTDGGISHDHQVLAIGYDPGRYQGDLGAYKDELRIYIFDPNHPGETVTLVPNSAGNEYHYLEYPNEMWRTYFVDGKYFPMTPPSIPNLSYPADGLVHELRFRFLTGIDDMRGGPDHVDVTITLADNTVQSYPNISQGGRWLPDWVEIAQVILTQPVAKAAIRTITVTTNAAGGLSGDNWDVVTMQVIAVGNGFATDLLTTPAGPYRFTGARVPMVVQVK